MIAPRFIKILRDLWSSKARTLLVALSISIGVFAVGFVATSYITTSADLVADIEKANAHSASIYTYPVSEDLLASARKVEGVGAAEGRSIMGATLLGPNDKTYTILINAVPKISKMSLDVLRPVGGNTSVPNPGFKEALIDSSALTLMAIKPGDSISLRLSPDDRERQLRVVGFVHDATTAPAQMTNVVTAYINLETIAWLGGSQEFVQMLIQVAENPRDATHVRQVADAVAEKIRDSGQEVYATVVYEPGRHPAESAVQSLLTLMGAFGLLSVFLSGFLVVNTVNSLISQQVRQIGMMKAIGAHTSQVVVMYLLLVLCYGLVALAIALPLSSLVSQVILTGMSTMLNFLPGPFRIPLPSVIAQAAIALLVPAFAGLVPVLKGSRTTVHAAISNYGLGAGSFGKSWIDRLIEKLRFFSRPLLISLRNTFRKKGRLALTLSTLTLAGAIFVAVFNIQGSFNKTIVNTLGYFLSDINLGFNRNMRTEQVEKLAKSVPGVVSVEPWLLMNSRILSADKQTSTEVTIVAPPAGSQLVDPVLTSGRWLVPDDQNALAIGNHLLELRPEIKIGDTLTMTINDREYPFQVVGNYQMAGTVIPPFVYANYEYVSRVLNQPGRASQYRIKLAVPGPIEEQRVATQLKQVFQDAGVPVADVTTGTEIRAQQGGGFEVVIYFLMGMSILIGVVGGLGLMGTMSMNVIERTREIGVMRSIGASNGTIMGMVVFEGMFIGILSWLLALVLAYPISKLLNDMVGMTFIKAPMDMVINPQGFIIWLIIVCIISALASLIPAWNAVRLTVRDVLAYE